MALGSILPTVDSENAHFWQSGADGQLQILRCHGCGLWLHPPAPVCRRCRSKHIGPEIVSGRGRVFAFTVNYHQWRPDMDVPFIIATVELAEQQHLRLISQIVGCAPEDIYSGMPVEVGFVSVEDVWLPVFSPTPDGYGPERRTAERL